MASKKRNAIMRPDDLCEDYYDRSPLEFQKRDFKSITYIVRYYNFHIGEKHITKTKINSNGEASITDYDESGRTKRNIIERNGHVKNMQQLHEWIMKIREIVCTANINIDFEDGGGSMVIESLVFDSFKMKSISGYLSNDECSIQNLKEPEIIIEE